MESSAPASNRKGGVWNKILKTRDKIDDAKSKVKAAALPFVAPFGLLDTQQPMQGNTAYDQVTEDEEVAAFVYKMDKPWLQAGELRVEIRWGNALWVIGLGDETIKVKLRKNHKMRLSKATASMSAEGVLTVVIPKRHQPLKWHDYKDLAFDKLKTVDVEISWSVTSRRMITPQLPQLSIY